MQNNDGVFLACFLILLSIWKRLTLEVFIVKDFIMLSVQTLCDSQCNLKRFSEITIEYSYSMVTFSVLVVCDVIVFMELLISYIFKGTWEICHSKWKSVIQNEYVLKFDQLSLRHKTATGRKKNEESLQLMG